MKLGKKLREARKAKNMTLQELSEKSGVALATLSRIETNKMTGTIESHLRICKTLGISIARLYGQLEDATKTAESLPSQASAEHYKEDDNVLHRLLVPRLSNKKMMPVFISLDMGSATKPEMSDPGIEKFAYMIKGRITARVGDQEFNMKSGDSLYYDASLEHEFKNTSKQPAELITVTTRK